MSSTPSAQAKKLSESYRMTELGPLPEEWQVARLGEEGSRIHKTNTG